MMTAAPRNCWKRRISGSSLETTSYRPPVAVGILGRNDSSLELQAAEKRAGRGESP
jgi:hypothetical protein